MTLRHELLSFAVGNMYLFILMKILHRTLHPCLSCLLRMYASLVHTLLWLLWYMKHGCFQIFLDGIWMCYFSYVSDKIGGWQKHSTEINECVNTAKKLGSHLKSDKNQAPKATNVVSLYFTLREIRTKRNFSIAIW